MRWERADIVRAGALVAVALLLSRASVAPPVTFAVALIALYGVVAHKWPRPEPVRMEPRTEPSRAARPVEAPRPAVPPALRAVDGVWLLLMAMVAPVLGLGMGSSCEGCPSVRYGLWFTWAGLGLVALAYAWSLRRGASPHYARAAAIAVIPATWVVLTAGMWIGVGQPPAFLAPLL